MPVHTNETLIRKLYTAFNDRKYDQAEELVSDTFEWRDIATGETYRGPAGVRQFMEHWVKAFNDAKIDPQRVIATDQFVAAEIIGRGTHTGSLESPAGSIPATNRRVELPCCEVAVIENGKIRSGSTYYDAASIMHQLGVTELAGAHR
jgi:steroid delta-isomerase-like uncharacterized protein